MWEKYFGVGWYLEFLKKDFRMYMRICWIDLQELEDNYYFCSSLFVPYAVTIAALPGRLGLQPQKQSWEKWFFSAI